MDQDPSPPDTPSKRGVKRKLTREPDGSDGDSSHVLRWLREYTMHGAEFNSSKRDPPPRCHPGTRTNIIQRARDWTDNPNQEKRLLWLRGPAGVGKSAIIQTLAEILSRSRRLGASLFFSRPNGRSNPRQVFPTLAYRLATQDAAYKTYLTELMLEDPASLDRSLSEQFRILIEEPFAHRRIRHGQNNLLLSIDGLDECGGDPDLDGSRIHLRRRTGDRVQCEIVRLISEFISNHPTVPLLWAIASRPETHLKAVFSDEDVVGTFIEEDIPIDSTEACRDVELFLHNEFKKIKKNYPDHITEAIWPNHDAFLRIAKASSGLFVFAEVVARFIDDPRVGNPIAHLKYVLAVLSRLRVPAGQANPLASLDGIYTAILERVPSQVLSITTVLLSIIIVTHHRDVHDFRKIREPLNISRENAITALRQLHSVLYFPPVTDVDKSRPRFYHASFQDFLEDASRSGIYFSGRSVLASRLVDHYYLPRMFGKTPMAVTGIREIHEMDDSLGKADSYRALRRILRAVSRGGTSSTLLSSQDLCHISSLRLQSILEGLDFSQMASNDGMSNLTSLGLYDQENLPATELKRRGILSSRSLESLGLSSADIMEATYVSLNYFVDSVSLVLDVRHSCAQSSEPITAEIHKLKGHIISRFLQSSGVEVLVWGSKERQKCAVMQVDVEVENPWEPVRKLIAYVIGFDK
ncbi:hypothetical protein NP233_g10156 [Leucocoprinus birnbaumii]|uniref:NACHT domain-containing protein n=1 Tax=Leucocoprinus birnbaumii TaxID=56174 RepID=A0AAD5VIU3_9AGAR|nr:hypothetical protein NP233_g10156 [Leucocoprinus birnbaumii]